MNIIKEQDIQRVLDEVDTQRDEIIELEQTLVRFDSVNMPPWGKEGPCQAFMADKMRDLGLQVNCFAPDEVPGITEDPAWLWGRDYTERPNVVGTLKGSGAGPSLHLAAHVDVVPIEKPAEWIVGPFSGEIIGGKIYGRGALDDKDGLTAMLASLKAIQAAGYRLRGDLILSSYADEEFGGGNGLLAVVRKGYRGDAAINCDGVASMLWVASTGGGPFRVLIQSRVQASHPTASMRRVQAACQEALGVLSQRWRTCWEYPLYPPGTPWILKRNPLSSAPGSRDGKAGTGGAMGRPAASAATPRRCPVRSRSHRKQRSLPRWRKPTLSAIARTSTRRGWSGSTVTWMPVRCRSRSPSLARWARLTSGSPARRRRSRADCDRISICWPCMAVCPPSPTASGPCWPARAQRTSPTSASPSTTNSFPWSKRLRWQSWIGAAFLAGLQTSQQRSAM